MGGTGKGVRAGGMTGRRDEGNFDNVKHASSSNRGERAKGGAKKEEKN